MATPPRTNPHDQSGATQLSSPEEPAPRTSPEPPEPAPTPTRTDVTAAQRNAFGGIKWGAAFFGWLSANGVAIPLIALAGAAGTALGITAAGNAGGTGAAVNNAADEAGTIGLTGGLILLAILMVAYFAGGYVAGRMSRFDGARQGLAVWLIGILAAIAVAALAALFGSRYDIFTRLNLPSIPVDGGTATTAGLIALAAVVVGTLIAAVAGGKLGERYHRKVDKVGGLN